MGIDLSRGFVAFPRGLTEWEWYTEPNTVRLFFHLLLSANWKEKQWQGIIIRPGQLVTSQPHLAKQLGLSVMQVRTALEHLKSSDYITVKTGSKYSIITLNCYDLIAEGNRRITGRQQADNNNLTINNIKNINKSSTAAPEPTDRPTTSPVVTEFEAAIGKLSATGKAELAGYTDRLGEALVQHILHKCVDAGGKSWAYVRKALLEAEAGGCRTVEEYQKAHPLGAGRNKRVDRPEPSGNDFLKDAARRPRRLKKKEADHVPEP